VKKDTFLKVHVHVPIHRVTDEKKKEKRKVCQKHGLISYQTDTSGRRLGSKKISYTSSSIF
jgi:hypothetical protein